MSPNVASATPGSRPSSMAKSMSRLAVTQTGHPGPDSSVTFSGIKSRRPKRAIATVCVPHTSMSFIGRSAASLMSPIRGFASSGSRHAERMSAMSGAGLGGVGFDPLDVVDELPRLGGELLVDDLDREAGVGQDPRADLGGGRQEIGRA